MRFSLRKLELKESLFVDYNQCRAKKYVPGIDVTFFCLLDKHPKEIPHQFSG
jgi:hypothetical protein